MGKSKNIDDLTYQHELIEPNLEYYNRLVELTKDCPQLIFNNKGYEGLSKEIVESHQEQIQEISKILKETLLGFSRFQNFKPRNDGSVSIRLQYRWSNRTGFVGVGYFSIEYWNPEVHKKLMKGCLSQNN